MSTSTSFLITGGNQEIRIDLIGQLLVSRDSIIDPLCTLTSISSAHPKKLSKNKTLNELINDPDLVILTGDVGNIGVDLIRDLQARLSTRPTSRLEKVAVITRGDNLTEEAQNSLLKILEEPPDNTVIIILAQNPDNLLLTILSRCLLITLPQATPILPNSEKEKLAQLIKKLPNFSIAEKFKLAENWSTNRQEALTLLENLLIVMHEIITNNPDSSPTITLQIEAIFAAKTYLSANCNVRLTLENLLLNW